ncbi:hypothetical protein DZD52_15125 [Xanthomonas nasturtii]|uniref:Uncharacterized protein n=1 Tax=Xanthomonas nasturtii TaxID=1843581 RepID=A0A3E1KGL9_9XANT|nr:hypothetical protein DZD52_15125 [Xanthomonas nasturtii]
MTCSSVKRFFTSNLLRVGNWTPNCGATQNRGDVANFSLSNLHFTPRAMSETHPYRQTYKNENAES